MGNKLCTDETKSKGNEFALLCFLGCSLKDDNLSRKQATIAMC